MANSLSIDFLSGNPFGPVDGIRDDANAFVETSSISFFNNSEKQYTYIVAAKGVGKSALYDYLALNPQKNIFIFPIDMANYAIERNFFSKNGSVCCFLIEQIVKFLYKNCTDDKNRYNFFYLKLRENNLRIPGIYNDSKYERTQALRVTTPVGSVGGEEKTEGSIQCCDEASSFFSICLGIIMNYCQQLKTKLILLIDGVDECLEYIDININPLPEERKTKFMNELFYLIRRIKVGCSSYINCKLFIRDDLFNAKNFCSNMDKELPCVYRLSWSPNEIMELIGKRLLCIDVLYNIVSSQLKSNLNPPPRNNLLDRIKNFRTDKKEIPRIDSEMCKKAVSFFLPHNLLAAPQEAITLSLSDWIVAKFSDCNGCINPRIIIAFFNELCNKQANYYKNTNTNQINYTAEYVPIFHEEIFLEAYDAVKEIELARIMPALTKQERLILKKIINESSVNGTYESLISENDKNYLNKLKQMGVIKLCGSTKIKLSSLLIGVSTAIIN